MRNLFVVIVVCMIGLSATAQFTFKGEMKTSDPYTMTLYECTDWHDMSSGVSIPYQRGVFGKKGDFMITGMEAKRYILVFENQFFTKIIFFDLRELDVKRHKMRVDIMADTKNVTVKWEEGVGITWNIGVPKDI